MDKHDLTRIMRESLSVRRLVVTLGVSGTMGITEWLGLGHPIGLVFSLVMGLATVTLAPLPWLLILPWGMKRPPIEIALRAAAVLACSAAAVGTGFFLYILAVRGVVRGVHPMVPGARAYLSAWSSMVISIPLFAAAGWGLSRHMQLERRLEVHDERELALRNALEEARMLALRSRLDPHFLFNTLNLVAELCREDPPEAERCVVRLSGLLRAALDRADQPLVPLGRELDLCADYLDLCRVRFGQRMRVTFSNDAAVSAFRVPPLAVQVLCENAVRHGIESRPEGGVITISSQRSAAGNAIVTVTSPGPFRGDRKGGIGLDLTRRRLVLAFGHRASLEVQTTATGDHTDAILTLPGETGR